MPYLFAHFKEKITPDGEAVYFGKSRDGFNWEKVNNGNPVLMSSLGEKGCRDIEIIRLHTGGFAIITTDLCVANRYDENLNLDWKNINSHGSKSLCIWKTPDLVNFSEQKLQNFGRDDFGCMWAPETFYDEINDEYLIHWGSTVAEDDYKHMSIYCSVTKDFETFSTPKLFFTKDNEILDTHIRKIDGVYHMFYKNAHNPSMNMHATSDNLYGPYTHDKSFEEYMEQFPQHQIYTFMLKGEHYLHDIHEKPNGPFSLVFGNEATGLPDRFLDYGESVLIKHSGEIDSLNLSIAFGVAAHTFSQYE